MVWDYFSWHGQSPLVLVQRKPKAVGYETILDFPHYGNSSDNYLCTGTVILKFTMYSTS